MKTERSIDGQQKNIELAFNDESLATSENVKQFEKSPQQEIFTLNNKIQKDTTKANAIRAQLGLKPSNDIPSLKIYKDKLEKNLSQEKIKRIAKTVQDLYFSLADKYLENYTSLKGKIIDYYSDFDRLQKELSVVFKDMSEEEINKRIEETKAKLEDKTFFIEHYQKIFERTEVINGIKKRMTENPLASKEEYELGVYAEGLETQVRKACFLLNKKGYKTFESGFREKDGDRDQYLGMYNKEVALTKEIIKYFEDKGFKISLVQHEDRTIINLHPEKTEAVSLDEWANNWNELAEKLPSAKAEDFSDKQNYLLHTSFRERQDKLRKR